MTVAALEATELYRFFHAGDDEVAALRGVSITVERRELVAIVGPSGSGKSTLLACAAGLDDPDGGTVVIDGNRMSRQREPARARLRARAVGVLFQSENLIGHLTVDENLALVQRLAGRVDRQRRTAVLEELGLRDRVSAFPSQLSGGEAARAGLAVALANNPLVLLADEPTGEIDAAAGAVVLAKLRDRAEAGGAVVVVTHSESLAAAADRVVRLRDGRVEA